MTIKELKALLETMPDDIQVQYRSYSEGVWMPIAGVELAKDGETDIVLIKETDYD